MTDTDLLMHAAQREPIAPEELAKVLEEEGESDPGGRMEAAHEAGHLATLGPEDGLLEEFDGEYRLTVEGWDALAEETEVTCYRLDNTVELTTRGSEYEVFTLPVDHHYETISTQDWVTDRVSMLIEAGMTTIDTPGTMIAVDGVPSRFFDEYHSLRIVDVVED